MNKSFEKRMQALEALEAIAEAERAPLTCDDCLMLLDQIALSNVRLENGRAVRTWQTASAEYTANLDLALRRCNVAMAAEPPPQPGYGPRFRDTIDIQGFLQLRYHALLDVDGLSDDEFAAEVAAGLAEGALVRINEELRVTCMGCASNTYWTRIVARAVCIRREEPCLIV